MAKDTTILSADTSTLNLSIALLKNGVLLAESETSALKHSSGLLPEIDALLKRSGLRIDDISAFCVGLGPGSFTGLRIGVTTMRGLAFSLKKPVIGISSMDCLAYNLLGRKGIICPAIDAKQNKVYSRIYKSNGKEIKPAGKFLLLGIKDLLKKLKGEVIFIGDAAALYRDEILNNKKIRAEFAPEALWYPKAGILGKLGLARLKAGKKDSVFTLAPLYIYPKECQIRRKRA